MKKLIYIFLNTKYPNAFVKKTIFGNITMCGDEPIQGEVLTVELCDWFNIKKDFARRNLKAWNSSLPVVVSLRNSTNPAILVSDTTVVNSTL